MVNHLDNNLSIPSRGIRYCRNLATFGLGLAITCGLIHSMLAERDNIPVVSEKLQWLSKYGTHYDTLFIGSSRVFRQIIPAIFDTKMKELGQPTRSYNLAADSMTFPETFHLLNLSVPMVPSLRNVVIELGGLRRAAYDESLRSEYWHTLSNTALLMRSICEDATIPHPSHSEQVNWLCSHAILFLRNYGNLGRGHDWLKKITTNKRAPILKDVGEAGCFLVERTMTAAEVGEFDLLLKEKLASRNLPTYCDTLFEATLRSFVLKLQTTGCRVVFVLMPEIRQKRPPVPPSPLIDLDDPTDYPAFWEKANRYDPHHLNAKGAESLSEVLAEAFAKLQFENRTK